MSGSGYGAGGVFPACYLGSWAPKQQIVFKLLPELSLLMSHCPKQVTQQSPESIERGLDESPDIGRCGSVQPLLYQSTIPTYCFAFCFPP